MLSAASTAPAPSPYGIANTQSIQNAFANEKPISPSAVSATLIAVTSPVPSLLVSAFEKKLAIIVPTDMIMVITPADDIETPKSTCIIGHAEPMSESGSPKLMNDR